MGFVVGYAPCGLSPQIDGMPVIPEKGGIRSEFRLPLFILSDQTFLPDLYLY
jgi:hypothetical protein